MRSDRQRQSHSHVRWIACLWLFLLSLATIQHETFVLGTPATSNCDRRRSRMVRSALEEYFFSELKSVSYVTAVSCPFHPTLDRFREQEERALTTPFMIRTYRSPMAHRAHRCQLCEKQFKNQFYLDMHLDRKHEAVIPQEATVCLADYCDIFGCDALGAEEATSQGLHPKDRVCDAHYMEKTRLHCNAIFDKCVDVNTGNRIHRLHDNVIAKICHPLGCGKDGKAISVSSLALERVEKSSISSVFYYVFVGLVIMGVVLYYVMFCILRSEHQRQRDFQVLRPVPLGAQGRPWYAAWQPAHKAKVS